MGWEDHSPLISRLRLSTVQAPTQTVSLATMFDEKWKQKLSEFELGSGLEDQASEVGRRLLDQLTKSLGNADGLEPGKTDISFEHKLRGLTQVEKSKAFLKTTLGTRGRNVTTKWVQWKSPDTQV